MCIWRLIVLSQSISAVAYMHWCLLHGMQQSNSLFAKDSPQTASVADISHKEDEDATLAPMFINMGTFDVPQNETHIFIQSPPPPPKSNFTKETHGFYQKKEMCRKLLPTSPQLFTELYCPKILSPHFLPTVLLFLTQVDSLPYQNKTLTPPISFAHSATHIMLPRRQCT